MEIQAVSAASIGGMFFTLVIAIGLPVLLFVLVRKKWSGDIYCFLLGACVFFVAAMVLEQFLHIAVLGLFGNLFSNNIWLYAMYGGLAAAVFEETGRLVAMNRFMKKRLCTENVLMYGIGHGGFESILVVGLSYINNIATSITINSGNLESSLANLDVSMKETALQNVSALWTSPAHLFYLAGVERGCTIMVQIALSVLMYCGVKYNKKLYIGLAYLLHFLVDTIAVLLSSFFGAIVTEIVLILVTALVVYGVYSIWKNLDDFAVKNE